MSGKIPDRWEIYRPFGSKNLGRIFGTRFVAFKVPLKAAMCARLPLNLRFTPEHLLGAIKNLGLIIDLTNTSRYYNAESEFINRGVKYEKIFCEGKVVPSTNVVQRFFRIIDNYIAQFPENDTLIGVHCTHGINRTGYLVCSYMIQRLGFDPSTAILEFNKARECPIERENYIQALYKNYNGNQTRTIHEQTQPRIIHEQTQPRIIHEQTQPRIIHEQSQPRLSSWRQETCPSRPPEKFNRYAPHTDDRFHNRSKSNDRRDFSAPYENRPAPMAHPSRRPSSNPHGRLGTNPAPDSNRRLRPPPPHNVPYQALLPSPHSQNASHHAPAPSPHNRKVPYQVPGASSHNRKARNQAPATSPHGRRSPCLVAVPMSRREQSNDRSSSHNNNYVDDKGAFNRQKYVWKKGDAASSTNHQSHQHRPPFQRK